MEERIRQRIGSIGWVRLLKSLPGVGEILSATIYLPDMKDFPSMNAVWDAWVPQGHTPARATVEAGLASSDYKIEIQVVAAK